MTRVGPCRPQVMVGAIPQRLTSTSSRPGVSASCFIAFRRKARSCSGRYWLISMVLRHSWSVPMVTVPAMESSIFAALLTRLIVPPVEPLPL
ncbi:hypothetical protein D3C72_1810340 [compost metagenome]